MTTFILFFSKKKKKKGRVIALQYFYDCPPPYVLRNYSRPLCLLVYMNLNFLVENWNSLTHFLKFGTIQDVS
jgi:hypothetical protein